MLNNMFNYAYYYNNYAQEQMNENKMSFEDYREKKKKKKG